MRSKNLTRFYCTVFLLLLLVGCNGCLFSNNPDSSFNKPISLEKAAICNAHLALSFLKSGHIQHAQLKLLKAYQQAPHLPLIKSARACFLEQVGEIQKAEQYHLQAIALSKTSGMIHYHYGTFLLNQKRYQEAKYHFLIAVQDIKFLETARAYEHAAFCAVQMLEYNKAIYYFTKALAYNPLLKEAPLHLIKLLYNQKKYISAQKFFEQYITQYGNMTAFELKLGFQIARALNRNTQAQQYRNLLFQKYPQSEEYQTLQKSYH